MEIIWRALNIVLIVFAQKFMNKDGIDKRILKRLVKYSNEYKDVSDNSEAKDKFREQIGKIIYSKSYISVKGSGPDNIQYSCENIKKIVDENFKINYPSSVNMIGREIIIGYFKASKLLMDKYNKILSKPIYLISRISNSFAEKYDKTKKKCREEYNKCFEDAFNLYNEYPHKDTFTEILKFINFKTGPLSEEDIRLAELYHEKLHHKECLEIENITEATGCFGICGPRGVGKSTLLNTFIKKSKEKFESSKSSKPLIVKLTIPTKYKPDEFLITLLSKICENVKDKIKGGKTLHILNIILKVSIGLGFLVLVIFALISGLSANEAINLPDIVKIFDMEKNNLYTASLFFAIFITIYLIVFRFVVFDKIKIYNVVSRIYEDLKFKKTVEITGGVSSRFLSVGRRTTFVENPINYTEPALSAKITETIKEITEKAFSKVVVIIDDIDKLEKEDDRDIIFKSIRFLSSAKNCLALLSVREGLQHEFSNEKSEVRTLFDDIIVLKGINGKNKSECLEDIKQLIAHRIINEKVGNGFLENEKIIRDKNFWDDLLRESGGIPREAIRWFDRSFRKWLDSEADRTIDDEFKDIMIDIDSLLSKIEKEEDVEKIGWHVWGTTRASEEAGLKLIDYINIVCLASKIEKEEDIEKIGSCVSDIAKASEGGGLNLVNLISTEDLGLKIEKEEDIEKIGSCVSDIAKASEKVKFKKVGLNLVKDIIPIRTN